MISLDMRKQLRDFRLDVAFELDSGRCLALVGPTGCGKTTTLRIIAGLETPDEGRVLLDGKPLVDAAAGVSLPPQKRHVGMVFQQYALLPHFTVLGNVMYGARARGMSKPEARAMALEALRTVQLETLADVRPAALSGGQQQRVALARALAAGAKVLLMDEPMSALDATTRRDVRTQLRQLIRDLGIQTIIVTHDAVDALTLGDCICVMQQGRVVQIGDRRELLASPRNTFVAEFLGINLLSGEAFPGPDGMCRIRCQDVDLYSFDQVTGPAMLVCYPWDISLSLEAPEGSALNVVKGRVTAISHLGGRTRVTIENGISLAVEITHTSDERLDLSLGREVFTAFKASSTRVYQ